jgi:excisionase family DNA binding protein
MTDTFLTVKEVAKKLRVSERSIFRYIHSGRLKASKVGYWRIREKDLKEFILKNSNKK